MNYRSKYVVGNIARDEYIKVNEIEKSCERHCILDFLNVGDICLGAYKGNCLKFLLHMAL